MKYLFALFALALFAAGCVNTDRQKSSDDSKAVEALRRAGVKPKQIDAAMVPEAQWADTICVALMPYRDKDEKIPEVVKCQPIKLSSAVFENVIPMAEVSQTPRRRAVSTPDYPRLLAKQRVPGRVVVGFVIGVDGRVGKRSVIKATSVEFADAVTTAVSQWTFFPGKLNGAAVPTLMVMAFEFRTMD